MILRSICFLSWFPAHHSLCSTSNKKLQFLIPKREYLTAAQNKNLCPPLTLEQGTGPFSFQTSPALHSGGSKLVQRGLEECLKHRLYRVSPPSLLAITCVQWSLHKNPKGQGSRCLQIAEQVEACRKANGNSSMCQECGEPQLHGKASPGTASKVNWIRWLPANVHCCTMACLPGRESGSWAVHHPLLEDTKGSCIDFNMGIEGKKNWFSLS